MEKLKLERSKQRTEVLKWIVIAIGAVVSFFVIDFGRLQLEKFQATAKNERELLAAYLTATKSVQPEVWKRKLQILKTSPKSNPLVNGQMHSLCTSTHLPRGMLFIEKH